ncbi:conserved phage C-terminal domain-containing protein, partial [Lactobacillus crispatus]|uniref:conserved phage C-terminal domain-containing protein n=1 Tax=Lactobacillus crispatus TaxID=47770 RepID=UPI001C4E0A95
YSNNRTTNRTVEDTYSSADAEPPIPYKEIIDYLNKKTNQHLRYQTKAYQKLIRQRFEEGATLEDFKKAIDNQAYAWQGTKFWKYMRPSTLFRASKFDSYVNANDLNQAKQPSNGGYGGEPNISDIPDDDLPF